MKRIFVLPLLFVFISCSDKHKSTESVSINTPVGNIASNQTTSPAHPKVEKIHGEKLEYLQSLSKLGPGFITTYCPNEQSTDLKAYDRAFHAWQTSNSPKHSKEQVTEILGGCLGNKLVSELNMEWVLVTDKYGTDYAVRSNSYEVLAFPFSTVLKRIEDNEYDFMNSVFIAVKHSIESGNYKPRK